MIGVEELVVRLNTKNLRIKSLSARGKTDMEKLLNML